MTPEERAAAYDLAERLVRDHPACTTTVDVRGAEGYRREPAVSLHRSIATDRSQQDAEGIAAGLYGVVTLRTTGGPDVDFVRATVSWRGVDIELNVFHAPILDVPEPVEDGEAGR